jgi:hypothetical protein
MARALEEQQLQEAERNASAAAAVAAAAAEQEEDDEDEDEGGYDDADVHELAAGLDRPDRGYVEAGSDSAAYLAEESAAIDDYLAKLQVSSSGAPAFKIGTV